MGTRYIQHKDNCKCKACIKAGKLTYDSYEDPDYLECGCHKSYDCKCSDYNDPEEIYSDGLDE